MQYVTASAVIYSILNNQTKKAGFVANFKISQMQSTVYNSGPQQDALYWENINISFIVALGACTDALL